MAGEVYEVWVMQVILLLWNLNLQGALGGPMAFGVNTARPTGLSSAAPDPPDPEIVPTWETVVTGSKDHNSFSSMRCPVSGCSSILDTRK